MHEMPVTEEILRIVTVQAQRAGATRVKTISLVIGELTSFINESIQFYFDLLAPGTVAEGATLEFRRIPTRFRCRLCRQEFTPAQRDWRCPHCGAIGGEVIAGKEFFVESIEVEYSSAATLERSSYAPFRDL